jgi:hypothetical protein
MVQPLTLGFRTRYKKVILRAEDHGSQDLNALTALDSYGGYSTAAFRLGNQNKNFRASCTMRPGWAD